MLGEIEQIAGPAMRRLEERADGRDLVGWQFIIDHEDVEVSAETVPEMADRVVAAREAELNRILADEGLDGLRAFYAYWMAPCEGDGQGGSA